MIKQYKLRFYNFKLVILLICDQSVWSAAGSKCVSRSSKQTAFGRCDGACVAGDLIVNGLFLDIEFPVDHVWF